MPVIPFPSPGTPKALLTLFGKLEGFPRRAGAVLGLSPEEAEAWDWLVSIGWKPHRHRIVLSGDRWVRFVEVIPQAVGQPKGPLAWDGKAVDRCLERATREAQRALPVLGNVARALMHVVEAITLINQALLDQQREEKEVSTCSDAE